MESFIEATPVTHFLRSHNLSRSSPSRRRPRLLEKPSHQNDSALLLWQTVANRRFAPRITCSAASPGMSQSHDGKQKDKHNAGRSKAHFDRRNLEMGWKFQTRTNDKPVTCEACTGTGRVECSWCHATGVLMLGDRLICSIEGHSQCLACDNGEVKCKECKGTGKVASWMVMKDL